MQSNEWLRRIILSGLFVALSVVLKQFALTTAEFRLSFYDLPLFIGGMVLGPMAGLAMGFATDWVYVMINPFAFTFNFMTLSAMMWGLMGGVFFHPLKRLNVIILAFVIIGTSLIAFTLNSVQLYIMYGSGMLAQLPLRIVTMLIKWPIQIFAIHFIYHRVLVHTPYVLSKP